MEGAPRQTEDSGRPPNVTVSQLTDNSASEGNGAGIINIRTNKEETSQAARATKHDDRDSRQEPGAKQSDQSASLSMPRD